MNMLKTSFFRVVLVMGLIGLLVPGCGRKTEGQGPVAQLVARMPDACPGLLVVPEPAKALESLGTLNQAADSAAFREKMAEVLAEQGADIPMDQIGDLHPLLDAFGIDGSRPLGVAFLGKDFDGVAYVPLASEEVFRSSPLAVDTEPLEFTVAGVPVEAGIGPDACWFISDGYAVLSQGEAALRTAAEAFGTEHEPDVFGAALQEEAAAKDVVARIRMDNDAVKEIAGSSEAASLLREWYRDVLASVLLVPENGPGTVHIRAYKRTPSDSVPDAIALRHPNGPETLVNVALQECTALSEMGMSISRDGGGGSGLPMNLVDVLLGNSMAFSVELGPGGPPVGKLSLQPMDPETLSTLLGEFALRGTPASEHGGVQLYTINGMPPMFGGLTYGLKDDILVASTTPQGVRELVDSLALPAPDAVDNAPNRADVTVDMAKWASSPLMQMATAMGGGDQPGQMPANPFETASPMTLQAWDHPDSLELAFTHTMVVTNLASIFGPTRRDRSTARSDSSQNNQKQIGLICMMYANESQGQYFPPLMETPGTLMFAATESPEYREGRGEPVYPDYLLDTRILINPGAADADEWNARMEDDPLAAVGDHHYVYLGYFIRDDAEMEAFADAYLAAVAEDGVPLADLAHEGKTIHRLREGVERMAFDPASDPLGAARVQSEVPIYVERPGAWDNGEVNVLYLDGHAERVPSGEFPNTEQFWANVARIDEAG